MKSNSENSKIFLQYAIGVILGLLSFCSMQVCNRLGDVENKLSAINNNQIKILTELSLEPIAKSTPNECFLSGLEQSINSIKSKPLKNQKNSLTYNPLADNILSDL